MTNPTEWPQGSEPRGSSTTDVAKDEAATVKDTAAEAGKNVAATAKDEASNVAAEAKQQAKSLLGSVTTEVQSQAAAQQEKLAATVHSLSQELDGMAAGSQQSGPLTDLAQQAARKSGEIAQWLENKEPRDVLTEVEAFARRRPVMFLALCGLAGVVAGRLTRGAVAANTSLDSKESGSMPTRALESQPETVAYDTAPDRGAGSNSMVEELPASYENSRPADLGDRTTPVFDDDPSGRSDLVR
jgi:hypothetical protein